MTIAAILAATRRRPLPAHLNARRIFRPHVATYNAGPTDRAVWLLDHPSGARKWATVAFAAAAIALALSQDKPIKKPYELRAEEEHRKQAEEEARRAADMDAGAILTSTTADRDTSINPNLASDANDAWQTVATKWRDWTARARMAWSRRIDPEDEPDDGTDVQVVSAPATPEVPRLGRQAQSLAVTNASARPVYVARYHDVVLDVPSWQKVTALVDQAWSLVVAQVPKGFLPAAWRAADGGGEVVKSSSTLIAEKTTTVTAPQELWRVLVDLVRDRAREPVPDAPAPSTPSAPADAWKVLLASAIDQCDLSNRAAERQVNLEIHEIAPGTTVTIPPSPLLDQPTLICFNEMLLFSESKTALAQAVANGGVTPESTTTSRVLTPRASVGVLGIDWVADVVFRRRPETGRIEAVSGLEDRLAQWTREVVDEGSRWLSAGLIEDMERVLVDDAERFPEAKWTATATEESGPSHEEKKYIRKRKRIVKEALKELVPHRSWLELHHTPSIAIAMSGGGYRAMVAAVGFLQGLKDIGVLQASQYVCGLSGSTYTLAQWLLVDPNLDSLLDHLGGTLEADLLTIEKIITLAPTDLMALMTPIVHKKLFSKPVAVADFFGVLVAHQLLADMVDFPLTVAPAAPATRPPPLKRAIDKLREMAGLPTPTDRRTDRHLRYYPKLSDVQLDPHVHPWPLFAAVTYDPRQHEYAWVAWDTKHVDVAYFDPQRSDVTARVPVWGLGREFVHGVSQEQLPEMPLPLLMGLWGSAFAGTISHAWDEIKGMFALPDDLRQTIERFVAEDQVAHVHPIDPTTVPNPWYDPDATSQSHLHAQPTLPLADAGLAFNYPLPPLAHPTARASPPDILILLDASADIFGAISRSNAARYNAFVDRWQLDVPHLPLDTLFSEAEVENGRVERSVYVIERNGKVLVYVPLVPEREGEGAFDPAAHPWCRTGNFVMTRAQARQLAQVVRGKVVRGREAIVGAIERVAEGHVAEGEEDETV
ncbi:hypothetical protein AMAG_10598 [Allomyces macrogynus ATCC 38327]|uniref:Lysophospholipase n=1 Tax=Allomyces macrogynus (strain ATCC 38327) TaxID=578462 RepID=A0A0L0SRE9_ALLM3|nr:hypothetical protein AMAG_10598 [Allomyces macrogynus ATCC 38327]|eukprot:KNE64934.1 hypothetical protein AMAG_10598 [Allomyces macrogynus ATCC 38327]